MTDKYHERATQMVLLFEQWWKEGHACPACGGELTGTTAVTVKHRSGLVFAQLISEVPTTTVLWRCEPCPSVVGDRLWSIKMVIDALLDRQAVFDELEES